VILIELAQFGLSWRESWNLSAERLSTNHVQLRIPPDFITLNSKVPVRHKKTYNRFISLVKCKRFLSLRLRAGREPTCSVNFPIRREREKDINLEETK